MQSKCRTAFEAQYKTELDKRALIRGNSGDYALMQTYQAWVNFQLGWEKALQEAANFADNEGILDL